VRPLDSSVDPFVRGLLLQDSVLSPEREMVAANAITLSRGIAALVVLALALAGEWGLPLLVVASVMWLTDALDGYVARHAQHRGARERVDGKILDPLMDDVAFICGFLALLAAGAAPLWFVAALLVCRVLFALIRMLGLAERRASFAGPILVTKASGAVLAVGQLLLLTQVVLPASPFIGSNGLRVAALAAMTAMTTCSVVYFAVYRHGHLLRRLLTP
jgi:phosphatidylglycerophosphate synthase